MAGPTGKGLLLHSEGERQWPPEDAGAEGEAMQFHLDGMRPGDPDLAGAVDPGSATDEVDALIVGCGPAGLTLAAQLSVFPEISVRIIERKPGPLQFGQADGIACRSMEMFQAFGFAERVAREAYWVNEVAFWRPGHDGTSILRSERIQDVEDDLSEMPHVILSQARIHDFLLERMANGARRLQPEYGCELIDLASNRGEAKVEARFTRTGKGNRTKTVRARYVVGCDGARSTVRRCMGLGFSGESARQLWGVMDILCVTDFPDIRLKCAIQSANQGSVIIIPREGGYLVRLYVELDELRDGERVADRGVTVATVIDRARAILSPYRLEVKEVGWWSAYEIGQRVCDRFDDGADPRIFIAGDACHTHSPKAGQGMNVAMADAFNLGWKLAAVIRGQAKPKLLCTYSEERRAKAKELIDFDRDMARLISERPGDAEESDRFQRYFVKHGRYTAGVEACYAPSLITLDDGHQHLARGLTVGRRFHSAPVVRVSDAKRMELGHCLTADGRWRLILFAPEGERGLTEVGDFCAFLESDPESPLRFNPEGADPDGLLDLRAVFQMPHRDVDISAMPALLLPRKGRHGLIDYEKIHCPDLRSGPDIFDHRGIDRQRGALVVVRPDQFVADVLPVGATDRLSRFFGRILRATELHPATQASHRYGTIRSTS